MFSVEILIVIDYILTVIIETDRKHKTALEPTFREIENMHRVSI